MDDQQKKNEQKADLSFFAPVQETRTEHNDFKKNIMILLLGATAGLVSALIAHMLANTISIMFWAFTQNGPMYLLVLYGQLFVYTIGLYVFSYWMFRKWDHTKTQKLIYLASYFLLYVVMILFWVIR